MEFIDGFINSEDLVTLEVAKQLKKLGFKSPTFYYYLDKYLPFVDKGLKRVKLKDKRMNHNKYEEYIYSAPTKVECDKWLLKNKIEL